MGIISEERNSICLANNPVKVYSATLENLVGEDIVLKLEDMPLGETFLSVLALTEEQDFISGSLFAYTPIQFGIEVKNVIGNSMWFTSKFLYIKI